MTIPVVPDIPIPKIARSRWFAVYTRSRAEKKVAQMLELKDIEHYLPLQMTIRQWSDRKKKVAIPLISGYIFVKIGSRQTNHVLETPGVLGILRYLGKPVAIPDWEISNLKILLGSEVPFTAISHVFNKGEEVTITHGQLKGLRGTIQQFKGRNKLVITINALDYNLTIDIDLHFVEPAGRNE